MAWWDGLDATFAERMKQFMQAAGGRLVITSAYRSVEEQQALWDDALNRFGGDENQARMWVAPPGKSNHNRGMAVDLDWLTDDAWEWAHANAARFGLVFPMEWEPWHIEPMGLRDGTFGTAEPEAYTTPPPGFRGASDPSRYQDMGIHLETINAMLLGPGIEYAVQNPELGQNMAAKPTMNTYGGTSSGPSRRS